MVLLDVTRFLSRHALTRRHLPAAIGRFARWQVGTRLLGGEMIHDWVGGTRIAARRGESAITGNIYCGLYEFEPMGYVLHATGPTDVFVDAGANAGSYTVLACGCRGARGYAFEPVAETYERLVRNTRLNNLDHRVHCMRMGLGSSRGFLHFTDTEDDMNHVTPDGAGGTPCPVVRLDDVLEGDTPSIIKIDVEGFEIPVLEGSENILQNPRLHSVLVEMNGFASRYGLDEERIFHLLGRHGFVPHVYDPLRRTLTPSRQRMYGIVLFVRQPEVMAERLRQAPAVNVYGEMV